MKVRRETLRYSGPHDWAGVIEFLSARAIPGVEIVEPERYRRTIGLHGRHGVIEVVPAPGGGAVVATLRFDGGGAGTEAETAAEIEGRIQNIFDLTADVGIIATALAGDPLLAPLVKARPGLRVPGGWDGFEIAVRAILGQQITVSGARALAGKLVADFGEPLSLPAGTGPGPESSGLTRVFPTPERLASADLSRLGVPRARAGYLSAIAAAAVADPTLFQPRRTGDLEAMTGRLRAIPGIGEWTAQYIALRGLRHPDAFPASDLGLLRAMAGPDGVRPTAATLLKRAEAWRPWRGYAAQHLWAADSAARTHARAGSAP